MCDSKFENPPNEDENTPISKADETEDLIAELCIHAPTENIKSCLGQYQYGTFILLCKPWSINHGTSG